MRLRRAGFTLIEIMVAMVAGMIVVGAVLAFTVASVRSNRENVQATRLSQELRTTMDVLSRELRRAGYDENAIRAVRSGATFTSPFSTIAISAGQDCVVYAFDRQGGTAGTVDAGEVRALRRIQLASGVGVVEIHMGEGADEPDCAAASADYTTFPPSCDGTSNWCPFSDPRVVDVTDLTVDAAASPAPITGAGMNLQVRDLFVQLTGQLASDPDVVRTLRNRVRVRADCIRTTAADCANSPTIAP